MDERLQNIETLVGDIRVKVAENNTRLVGLTDEVRNLRGQARAWGTVAAVIASVASHLGINVAGKS